MLTFIHRFSLMVEDADSLPPSCALVQGMATCHSLTTIAGELAGDPLDVKMFHATQWVRGYYEH